MKKVFLILFLFTSVCGLRSEVISAPLGIGTSINSVDGRTLIDETLDSKLMAASVPYRVYLPDGYAMKENSERAYPVIYLLHGLTGSYKNWSEQTTLKGFEFGTDVIIVMPEGANGWYVDSAANTNEKYESYIIKELIPAVEKKYRARTDRDGRAIAGLSMGGYGGLKFGVKYPEMFVLAGSFSGALRAAEWNPATLGGFPAAATSIKAAFGPMDSAERKANDIYKLVGGLDAVSAKKMPFFYIDCGTEDFLLQQSQDFAKLLFDKKIPHEFRQLPGGHNFKFWNPQVKQFLMLSESFITKDGTVSKAVEVRESVDLRAKQSR